MFPSPLFRSSYLCVPVLYCLSALLWCSFYSWISHVVRWLTHPLCYFVVFRWMLSTCPFPCMYRSYVVMNPTRSWVAKWQRVGKLYLSILRWSSYSNISWRCTDFSDNPRLRVHHESYLFSFALLLICAAALMCLICLTLFLLRKLPSFLALTRLR